MKIKPLPNISHNKQLGKYMLQQCKEILQVISPIFGPELTIQYNDSYVSGKQGFTKRYTFWSNNGTINLSEISKAQQIIDKLNINGIVVKINPIERWVDGHRYDESDFRFKLIMIRKSKNPQ